MGRAVFDEESPFSAQAMPVAPMLCRTESGGLHMGLLYRERNGEVAVLHLAWEDTLSRDWRWPRMWAYPDIEPERLRAVAGLCRQIWRRYQERKRFAYALAYHGTHFDVSGNLVLGLGARGLTCATFVLAVFKSFEIDLVDEADWPLRPEQDFEFVDRVTRFATPEHIDALRREITEGCQRILPDEVLGACACTPLPAKFAVARTEANQILARLDGR